MAIQIIATGADVRRDNFSANDAELLVVFTGIHDIASGDPITSAAHAGRSLTLFDSHTNTSYYENTSGIWFLENPGNVSGKVTVSTAEGRWEAAALAVNGADGLETLVKFFESDNRAAVNNSHTVTPDSSGLLLDTYVGRDGNGNTNTAISSHNSATIITNLDQYQRALYAGYQTATANIAQTLTYGSQDTHTYMIVLLKEAGAAGGQPVTAEIETASVNVAANDLQASLSLSANLTASSVQIAASDLQVTLSLDADIEASQATISANDLSASLALSADIQPSSVTISGGDLAALLSLSADVEPASVIVAAGDLDANISGNVVASLQTASVTVSAHDISADLSMFGAIDAGTILVNASELSVNISGNVFANLEAASVTISANDLSANMAILAAIDPSAMPIVANDISAIVGGAVAPILPSRFDPERILPSPEPASRILATSPAQSRTLGE